MGVSIEHAVFLSKLPKGADKSSRDSDMWEGFLSIGVDEVCSLLWEVDHNYWPLWGLNYGIFLITVSGSKRGPEF